MGVLSNNYAQIVPGALISASYVSDIYDVLMGDSPEAIVLSGSLTISGSTQSTNGFTGSLYGTSSWAISSSRSISAVTASYAISASYLNYIDSSSIADLALTASYIDSTFISASVAAAGFSSGVSNVNYANIFFVDHTNGDDITGQQNDFTKPYYTIYAALDAAAANSPQPTYPAIVVLRAGNYDENVLLRPNVYIYCDPGVIFNYGGFYDDASTGTSRVYGHACFYESARALSVSYGSDIYMEFDEIIQESSIFVGAIEIKPSTGLTSYTTIVANKIESNCKNGYVITVRNNAQVVIHAKTQIAGPGVGLYARPVVQFSDAFTGTVKIFTPKMVADNRTTPAAASNKNCIKQQQGAGTIEIYGDLVNLSNNFTYSPGSAAQQACICTLQNYGGIIKVVGNLIAGDTFGIYSINASGNDYITYDITGNISSKSIPVELLGQTTKVKIEGTVTKVSNPSIPAPCIYAQNACEVYAKNTSFINQNSDISTSNSTIIIGSSTNKFYFYNCIATNSGSNNFIYTTTTPTVGLLNTYANNAISGSITAAFTPQSFTQVSGLVLPNY